MAANLRGRVPQLPKESIWLHNALTHINAEPFPSGEIHSLSIGEIAVKIRKAVVEQTTSEQLELQTTVNREISRIQDYSGYCDAPGRSYYISSWASAGFSELDFSAAVKADPENTVPSAGEVVFAGGASNKEGIPHRLNAFILSRMQESDDGDGGFWCEVASPRKGMWDQMEQFLATL